MALVAVPDPHPDVELGFHGPSPAGDSTVAAAADSTAPVLDLVHVDPRDLVIGVNVRLDPQLDRGFVGSIRDRGVREPIIVHRDSHGRLVVRKGQRRTLAAIEAGQDRVPVVIEPTDHRDEAAAEIDRIIDQLGENQHRTAITDLEELGAHQQLLDLGLTAGQIARRTRTPVTRVRATLTVAGATAARDAVQAHGLTLDRAVVLAEFADDTEAVQALTRTARQDPERFEHVAQQWRDERDGQQARAALVEQLTAEQVAVVARPDSLFGGPTRRLTDLRATPDTEPGTQLLVAEHASCAGHVAWIEDRGARWAAGPRMVAVYGCRQWRDHGHAERHGTAGAVSSGRVSGPLSEVEKAERRTVIAHNKAWDAAVVVRRDWLRGFLARKTPPADAARYVATTVGASSHELRRAMENNHYLACELLGLVEPGEQRGWLFPGSVRVAEAAATATPGRATVLTLGLLLGALEDGTGRDTWRAPTATARAYFAALQSWGYALSDVEQLVLQPEHAVDAAAPGDAAPSDTDGPTTDHPGGPDGTDGPTDTANGADPVALHDGQQAD